VYQYAARRYCCDDGLLLLPADLPLTDLFKARSNGDGGALAPVSFWAPHILTTNNNITLAFAEADRRFVREPASAAGCCKLQAAAPAAAATTAARRRWQQLTKPLSTVRT